MDEDKNVPEQNPVQHKNAPAQTNFFNESTIYLIACALCLVGFFLNWFTTSQSRTYTNFDVTNPMNMEHTEVTSNSVTGTTLVSQIWNTGGGALLLLLFVLSIPLGALIVGSWKYYRKEIRNAEICWISFMTFMPILLVSLYLFAVDDLNFGFINLGNNIKDSFGGGLWMMVLGSLVLIYTVVSKVISINKKNIGSSFIKPGLLGGAICAAIIFILTKIFADNYFREVSSYYLFLPLIILSISIAIAVQNYKNSHSRNLQYSDIISIGFLTSLSGAILCIFLFKLFYSDYVKYVPVSILIIFVIIFTQLGFIISSIGTLWTTTNILYTPAIRPIQESVTNSSLENPNVITSQPAYTSQRPQVNINLPKVDWSKAFLLIKNFLLKYKFSLLIGIAILIVLILVYNLFIKPDPVKDAKKLATNFCNCGADSAKNNVASMQDYLKSFDVKKYKSKSDAKNDLSNRLWVNQTRYDSCFKEAMRKYNEKYAEYSKSGSEEMYNLQQTYNSLIGSCTLTQAGELASLQNDIDSKIQTIKDPEPDVEKIKTDLIGQKILGWNFNYVSEIKQATIVNTTHSTDRIEYKVDLHMIGYTQPETNYNDAEIIVTYNQGEQGWYLSNVQELYITYINPAPLNAWQKVVPLQNSTYSISNDKKFWVKDGDYGQTYKGGPDGDNYSLTSSYIFITSREAESINLIFTYHPKQDNTESNNLQSEQSIQMNSFNYLKKDIPYIFDINTAYSIFPDENGIYDFTLTQKQNPKIFQKFKVNKNNNGTVTYGYEGALDIPNGVYILTCPQDIKIYVADKAHTY